MDGEGNLIFFDEEAEVSEVSEGDSDLGNLIWMPLEGKFT